MIYQSIFQPDRPNRVSDVKNKEYDVKFAKFCIAQGVNHSKHVSFIENYRRNKNFYTGKQWIEPEDLEAFFKDETGQERNRIKVIRNIIRPMVEQYRGNAIRMSFNAKAKNISPGVKTRKEQALEKLLFLNKIATDIPWLKEDFKRSYGIGDTEDDTRRSFGNLWVDKLTIDINNFIKAVATENNLAQWNFLHAQNLALSGLCAIYTYERSGKQKFMPLMPDEVFWDRTARLPDLTDAEYMGFHKLVSVPYVIESAQEELSYNEMKALDEYGRQVKGTQLESLNQEDYILDAAKIPVFTVFWRDTEKEEYGYVKDRFDQPFLARINYTPEGADKPEYTEKDLIDPVTPYQKRLMGGKKKRAFYYDYIRFAEIIPSEIVAAKVDEKKFELDGVPDIVLRHGALPFQETEHLDPSNCKFPIKFGTWVYLDGEVSTPVDDAINPQRMINRMQSVLENQINNSRGSGTAYDKDMVDAEEGEDGLLRNMYQSKPIGFRARGRGIQNVVTSYDSTIGNGVFNLFNVINEMTNSVKQTTGVNDELQGGTQGNDQLVGVTRMMIQRGSLMQEPFYNSITNMLLQAYQSIATFGKNIYIDNESELVNLTGEDGAETIKLTKDHGHEDHRVFIQRDNPEEVLIQAGNETLLMLLQAQIIDGETFSKLYGKATPDEISFEIARMAKYNKEAQLEAAKQQKAEQAELAAHQEKQMVDQEAAMEKQIADQERISAEGRQHDLDKMTHKSGLKQAEMQLKADIERGAAE